MSSKGRRAHSSETLMYNSYRPNASFVGVLAAHFTLHVFDGNPLKLTGFEPQHSPFIYASVCQHHLRQSSHQGGKLARAARLRARNCCDGAKVGGGGGCHGAKVGGGSAKVG